MTHFNAPDAARSAQQHWQAEYEFYHKIITDEVERLRFNDGYEPVDLDLYPVTKTVRNEPDYTGRCRIGRQQFIAIAFKAFDARGNKVLRVQIRTEPPA